MLLSRVAANLYWAARYLERTEDTARVLRQHTELLVDLPTSIPLSWEPLLAIMGTEEAFEATGGEYDETDIVAYLASDRDNPGSIVNSLAAARENLRTTREVVPREAWQTVNDLHLFVTARHDEGVLRATRSHYMSHLVGECQRLNGMLAGTMSRDAAYEMMRLGRNLERSDMTTRVLDVRATSLLGGEQAHDHVQWAGVLKSLSAFQMFRRSGVGIIEGNAVVRFCLTDADFPDHEAPLTTCHFALHRLTEAPLDGLAGHDLHELIDSLQGCIAAVHDAVNTAYFRADTSRMKSVDPTS
jgi:uncharacterized alpha-E superfamily protein